MFTAFEYIPHNSICLTIHAWGFSCDEYSTSSGSSQDACKYCTELGLSL